jgi:capsid protein
MIQLVDHFGNPIRSEVSTSGYTGYEGAQTSEIRTSFAAFPINSRRELNSYTRTEFVRKVRALDANLPIFGRIARKIAQHSVGKGIFPRPITRDKDWNASNRKRFEQRMSNPYLYSVDSSRDLWEDQGQVAETMVGDGEYLAVMARKAGQPMIQPLDVFECVSPSGYNTSKQRWQDGVLTDAYDAPLAYGFRELPLNGFPFSWANSGGVRSVDAASVLHVFRRRRVKQTRGLSWFYSGVNDGIDALDLKSLEKGTAKLHSLLALAVRKKKGDAGNTGIAGQIQKALGGEGEVSRVDENFWRGAAITYLAEDEGIDLLSSSRPSPNLVAFVEFLYREVALATDLPLEVIYNLAALSGTAVRAVNESAQWVFDIVMDQIVMRHTRRIYIWDTANAILSGEQAPCKDPEWWAAAYRGPAKLTVDIGRSADAAIKLMKNAALSHVRYHEERAQDAYDEAEEEIQFKAWLKTRCAEMGVDYTELSEPTPGAVNNISVHQSDQP